MERKKYPKNYDLVINYGTYISNGNNEKFKELLQLAILWNQRTLTYTTTLG